MLVPAKRAIVSHGWTSYLQEYTPGTNSEASRDVDASGYRGHQENWQRCQIKSLRHESLVHIPYLGLELELANHRRGLCRLYCGQYQALRPRDMLVVHGQNGLLLETGLLEKGCCSSLMAYSMQ